MRATIVNCFDTYEDRVDLVVEFLKSKGYEVSVIQSDFRHFKKVRREESKEDYKFIKSNPYYKNLSFSRLYSHYKFAKDSFRVVAQKEPDLLYVLLPPNSLAKFAAIYKKKNHHVKLIYDLIDLWPETMPVGGIKKLFPFTIWRGLRDHNIKSADLIITECNLYQQVLGETLKNITAKTIYFAKKEIKSTSEPELSENEIHLAYLGSINNIIDIPRITQIVESLNNIKPVTLHVIGDGERKQELINKIKFIGANLQYYGKVYKPEEKQRIFDKCHFGLNIMKNSVCVGLTMKSIDYFQYGLPIINNIPADTANIIDQYKVGINISEEFNYNFKLNYFSKENNLIMRENALKIYKKEFSHESYFVKMEKLYKEYLK